jgi:S-adenosylmethionine:tRNA ribosyltransferase-isomerase
LFLRTEAAGDHAGAWVLLAQARGRLAPGERVVLLDRDERPAGELELVGRGAGGTWLARPDAAEPAVAILERIGRVPLPDYIRGGAAGPGDAERYQTVYAREPGSVAAPTAGLHFTQPLLAALADRGVGLARVTLHVGLGTFRPITAARLDDHPMHAEWCACPPETAAAVRDTRARGGRVVAVGTTAVRTLETAALSGTIGPWAGTTDLFIKPGFRFRAIDCLLTNFHMPRTTLMVLVGTLAGRETILRAYATAVRERYRFFSYGDAMFIE